MAGFKGECEKIQFINCKSKFCTLRISQIGINLFNHVLQSLLSRLWIKVHAIISFVSPHFVRAAHPNTAFRLTVILHTAQKLTFKLHLSQYTLYFLKHLRHNQSVPGVAMGVLRHNKAGVESVAAPEILLWHLDVDGHAHEVQLLFVADLLFFVRAQTTPIFFFVANADIANFAADARFGYHKILDLIEKLLRN